MNTNPFTEEHALLRQSFRRFLEVEIVPHIEEWEKEKHCPREIFEKMGSYGFLGVSYPVEYGGAGMDFWAAVVITEELMAVNMSGLALSLYAHAYLPPPLINAIGTEEQKQKYLAPALRGEKICSLGITEPGAGSDVGGIQTFAEDKGDHFIINGSKCFITNGTLADFVLLVVRTGKDYDMSLVLFDTDTPGFSAVRMDNKLGMHTSDTAQLFFDNCRVPKSALLGQQGLGFYYIMNNFQEERLLGAVMGTFAAEWALEKAKQYCKERQAFGKQLAKFQVLRHKLAQMAIKTEVCRAITYQAVHEFIEKGSAAVKIITMAKAFAAVESQAVINEALQIHGGWGFMEDYGLARAYRDCRLLSIGGGTTEVMHEIISKLVIDEVKHDRQMLKARVAAPEPARV